MEYLGIDIGGTQVKWGLIEDDGRVAQKGAVATDFDNREDEMRVLRALVEPWAGRVAGVGLSIPGAVLSVGGDDVVQAGGLLRFNDGFAIGHELGDACGLPVAVVNDGKACALGEYAAGALAGCSSGVVMVLGTGIGGGIVIDGRVLQGSHGCASEFSFMCCDTEGAGGVKSRYAIRGGWRSLRALVLEERERDGLGAVDADQVDGRQLFEWINADEPAALRGLSRYCRVIATQIVTLQAVIDPDVFAIGGGISAQPRLIEEIRRQCAEVSGGVSVIPVPNVVAAQHGNDANLLGAVFELRRRLGE